MVKRAWKSFEEAFQAFGIYQILFILIVIFPSDISRSSSQNHDEIYRAFGETPPSSSTSSIDSDSESNLASEQ